MNTPTARITAHQAMTEYLAIAGKPLKQFEVNEKMYDCTKAKIEMLEKLYDLDEYVKHAMAYPEVENDEWMALANVSAHIKNHFYA